MRNPVLAFVVAGLVACSCAVPVQAQGLAAAPEPANTVSTDAAGRLVLGALAPISQRSRNAGATPPQPARVASAAPRRIAHKGNGEAWSPAQLVASPNP